MARDKHTEKTFLSSYQVLIVFKAWRFSYMVLRKHHPKTDPWTINIDTPYKFRRFTCAVLRNVEID